MMRQERVSFHIIWKILVALLPILFGMPTVAMVFCAYNIAMTILCLGPITALIASLCAILISMFFCGTYGETAKLQGLFIGLEAALCGCLCAYAIIKKKGFCNGVLLSGGAFLILSFTELYNSALKAGMSVAQFLTGMPMELFKMQIASLNESGVNIPTETIDTLIDTIGRIAVMMVPSILVISSLAVGYGVMWLVTAQMRRLPVGITHSFAKVRLPKTAVAIMILSFALFFISPEGKFSYVFLNALIVLGAVSFFAGMSFVDFYLRRIIKNTPIRVIIHIFVFLFSTVFSGVSPYVNLFIVYILLASVDAFANFRKIGKEEEGGETDEAEEREN